VIPHRGVVGSVGVIGPLRPRAPARQAGRMAAAAIDPKYRKQPHAQ